MLAVGPGGVDKDGKRIEMSVQPGDRVLIPPVCLPPTPRSGELWKGRIGFTDVVCVL